jgi:DegV family protein with EDD domain
MRVAVIPNKVVVITDSVASLPPETLKQFPIKVVPISICFNGKSYRDGVDLSPAEAYVMLEKDPDRFAVAPATIGDYFKVYQEVASTGAQILVTTLSCKLSTMFNVANLAREYARDRLPQTNIEVMDSKTATVGEGLIALEAARAALQGKDLIEVTRVAREVRSRVKVEGFLNTIRYAYRTGRIPEFPARLGSYLNIKPLFSISGGSVHLLGLSRNHKKAIEYLINRIRRDVGQSPLHIAIAHAKTLEEGELLQHRLESEFNCVESWMAECSPLIAYATGAGILLSAYYADETFDGK